MHEAYVISLQQAQVQWQDSPTINFTIIAGCKYLKNPLIYQQQINHNIEWHWHDYLINQQYQLGIQSITTVMRFRNPKIFDLTEQKEFEHELQTDLIQRNDTGFEQQIRKLQSLYLDNKLLSRARIGERRKKAETQEILNKTKKRVAQMQSISSEVSKQIGYLKVQTSKVNDAFMMNKILMMERIIRMEKETQDLEKKRNQCYLVRQSKIKSQQIKKSKTASKVQRTRLKSLNDTQTFKKELDEVRCATMEMKRRKVMEVMEERERARSKSLKIEEYKQERARLNYYNKVLALKDEIKEKQISLNCIYQKQIKQEKKVKATVQAVDEYINAFFATQATTL